MVAATLRVADVLDHAFRVEVLNVAALIDAGQKAVAPQRRADDRLAGAQHDEAGQVLVLGAEAVVQPAIPCSGGSAACCRRS